MIGINSLNAGKLSSYIITVDSMNHIIQNVSSRISNITNEYQLISNDPAFYYKNANFIYGQYNNSVYISILLPIIYKGK